MSSSDVTSKAFSVLLPFFSNSIVASPSFASWIEGSSKSSILGFFGVGETFVDADGVSVVCSGVAAAPADPPIRRPPASLKGLDTLIYH